MTVVQRITRPFVPVALLLAASLAVAAAAAPSVPIGGWTAVGGLPAPRVGPAAVLAPNGDWLYSLGGRDETGKATSEVWRAHIESDGALTAWETQTALPVPLYLHVAVAARDHVYVIGGYGNAGYHNETWRARIQADGSLESWQRERDNPYPITLHCATVLDNRLYVVGGITPIANQPTPSNKVYFASIDTNGELGPWQETTSLPHNLYRAALVAAGNKMYVSGGYDDNTIRQEVLTATINGDGSLGDWWASAMPAPREYHQAVVHDGRLVLLGGRNAAANTGLTRVDSAAIQADGSLGPWTAEPPLPEPLYRLAAVSLHKYGSDYVYAWGGFSGEEPRGRVYRSAVPLQPTSTPTATATATRTPTPTATPVGAWAVWRQPGQAIVLPPSGAVDVMLDYHNAPQATELSAVVAGAARFQRNNQAQLTDAVQGTGDYILSLQPAAGARPGDVFYLSVRLGQFTLQPDPRSGRIGQTTYLPVVLRNWNPALAPTPTRTVTPSQTATATKTSTPTNTPTPTSTPTETPTLTPTSTLSHTPTVTPTATETSTLTHTPTSTSTSTNMPTSTPTETNTPTPTEACGWIEGFVYYDANGDGVRQSTEAGVSDVPIRLKQTTTVVRTTHSGGASGYYVFTNLPMGDYIIETELPTGYDNTSALTRPGTVANCTSIIRNFGLRACINIATIVSPANTGVVSLEAPTCQGGVKYKPGQAIGIQASPATGWSFINWQVSSGSLGNATSAKTTFTPGTIDATLTAAFDSSLCPVITAWRGEYWNNESLTGSPVLCRNDNAINFDWGYASPASSIPTENFSARWTRTISFSAGTYRFTLGHDDGMRVYIDNIIVFDNWCGNCNLTEYLERFLSSGNHTLKVEMMERYGYAKAQVTWQLLP